MAPSSRHLKDPASGYRAARRRVRRRLGLAPPQPRGWSVGPPDFVGVGTQRSGTTWWYRLICDHPGVAPGPGKERHYFDRLNERALSEADVHAYHRLFPRPPGARTGEWTPRYMHDVWTPAQLARAAPDARILVLLRDPWARFRSGLRHECRALGKQLRRDRGGYLRATIVGDALSRSLYARQLQRLFAQFDRSQVLVLQYERCCQDPVGQLRHTYDFLGLDPEVLPASIGDIIIPAPTRTGDDDDLWSSARAEIAEDAVEVGRLVPEIDLDLWPSVASAPIEAALENT